MNTINDALEVIAVGESFRTRLARWGFNFFPAYWATGARLTYIAADWREVRLKLPLTWRTRNYVGTIFGGSMFGALDPIYMVMLIKALGRDYVVWDKAATIRFRRPARTTLQARFLLPESTLQEIRRELSQAAVVERVFSIELTDEAGTVHASVEKTIRIARHDAPAPHAQEVTDMSGGA